MNIHRRPFLALAGSAALLAAPVVWSQSRTRLPGMTDGPFYPSAAWRQREADWDADLTSTQRGPQTFKARGEYLGLDLALLDSRGRVIDGAEVEIWQCDALAAYRHPSVKLPADKMDAGFQGFGAARASADGRVSFRTIRPVPYPGRTPHIHVKLRHASFGELTSQLFVAGDVGNARDFLWSSLKAADQAAVAMRLEPAAAGDDLRWRARHEIVLPG